MGVTRTTLVQILIMMKYSVLLLLGFLQSSQGLCLLNKCSSYWRDAKKNSTITGACAVLFDENCCDTGDTNFVIPRGGQGKMCGSFSSFNPLSSCKGPKLEDDVEGFIRNAKDLYNKEKLVLSAKGDANWIEELNDDFNDMNEDISSYRCTCGNGNDIVGGE